MTPSKDRVGKPLIQTNCDSGILLHHAFMNGDVIACRTIRRAEQSLTRLAILPPRSVPVPLLGGLQGRLVVRFSSAETRDFRMVMFKGRNLH